MDERDHLKALLVLLLLCPVASAGAEVGEERWADGCGRTYASAGAGPISASAEGQRSCEGGDFVEIALTEPQGRWQIVWERAGGEGSEYTLLAVARPPRYVGWYADASQCDVTFGAESLGCPVGAPPAPPSLPWGHLLP